MRRLDSSRFRMDFLVYSPEAEGLEEEIHNLGGNVFLCASPHRPWDFGRDLLRILRQQGPYDVIQSHVHTYSGFVLLLARVVGVPRRLAHSHTDTSTANPSRGLLRAGYLALMRRWVKRYCTDGLAVSRQAAADLFGSEWEADSRFKLLYCGIDLNPFQASPDPVSLRAELGIPPEALILGHVGRFVDLKNHAFLLEILREVTRWEPGVCLLLVGDGPLRPSIQTQAGQMGLGDRTIFTGLREDVPRLMMGAMDVFLLPSFYEGLPLSLLEAQAAGLPCFFSDGITDEVEVVKPLMRRLSLAQPAASWAEAILGFHRARPPLTQSEALKIVEVSPFNIIQSMAELLCVYEKATGGNA
jgi:glycosyltransferase involved in cell wall biosynthesis